VSDQPKPRRLLPLAEVENRVGLRKTAIYERMNRNEFPKPVTLGTTVRWVESELDGWIEERIKDRDQAA
jgi:prophage regulatory protein